MQLVCMRSFFLVFASGTSLPAVKDQLLHYFPASLCCFADQEAKMMSIILHSAHMNAITCLYNQYKPALQAAITEKSVLSSPWFETLDHKAAF